MAEGQTQTGGETEVQQGQLVCSRSPAGLWLSRGWSPGPVATTRLPPGPGLSSVGLVARLPVSPETLPGVGSVRGAIKRPSEQGSHRNERPRQVSFPRGAPGPERAGGVLPAARVESGGLGSVRTTQEVGSGLPEGPPLPPPCPLALSWGGQRLVAWGGLQGGGRG